MSALNPSASEVEHWIALVESALPTNALAARLALSNLQAAIAQKTEMGNVLAKELVGARKKIAESSAFENSLASLMLERETKPEPVAPSSPPRLTVVPNPHGERCTCGECHYRRKHPQLFQRPEGA